MELTIANLILQLMLANPGMSLDSVVTHPTIVSYMQEKCDKNSPNYEIIKPYCKGVNND